MSVFIGPPVNHHLETELKQYFAWYKKQFPLFPPPSLSITKSYLKNMGKGPYNDEELAEMYEHVINTSTEQAYKMDSPDVEATRQRESDIRFLKNKMEWTTGAERNILAAKIENLEHNNPMGYILHEN
jgi:hypothetical protein